MASAALASSALLSAVVFALAMAALASGFQYEVGEKMGWKKPTGDEPETYNEWAAKNRFRIGDSVHFTYKRDSVLVVSSSDYLKCDASNPISKLDNGRPVFQFDRPGFFYFVSGQPGHCKSGQRLIIRVMHPSEGQAPKLAPSPSPVVSGDDGWSSDNWGPPGTISSGQKFYVASYSMAALAAGVSAVLFLFM